MTFFLQDEAPPQTPPAAPGTQTPAAPPLPEIDPAGFVSAVSAAWRSETIRTDAWGYTQRRRNELAMEMYERLPMDAKQRIADRRFDHTQSWRPFEEFILAEAGQVAARDPVAWGDLPLDMDQFNTRIDTARKAELDEAEAVLALPGGGVAEFIGAGARAMTDQTSLALLPFGIGGGAIRTILGEAALGALGEAAVLPREFQVAEELGLPEPDATTRILTGAALGAGIAGVAVGAVRGVTYLRDRRDRQLVADLFGPEQTLDGEAAVAAAEARLTDELPPAAATRPTLAPPEGAEADDLAIVRSIVGVESGGRATAQNPNSTARGLGQFIDSTWMEMVRKHRPDLLQGRTPAQVLALRDDAQLNYEMTVRLTQDNRAALRAEGLPAGPAETYLAHFLGLGGASRALRLPLNAPISEVMSPAAIAANRGGRHRGKPLAQWTIGDLRAWARSKMSGAYDPNAPTDMPVFTGPTTRGYTGAGQVTSGAGRRVDVEYQVVDIASLRQATGALQPRDRSTANSDAWVAETASRLDPALLMPAPTADRGAPIVGPDGIIESGNGRVRAITMAYEQFPDRGAAYRGAIEELTGQPIPEGITRPVLIARRTSELDDAARRDWVIEAQDSGVAELTPIEAARVGARRLTTERLNALDLSDPDTIFTSANAGTLREVLADIPASQRNALFDRETKALNAEGKRRVRSALFARAWDQQDVVRLFVDLEDSGEFKTMLEALAQAAPDFAVLRAEIEAGLVDPAMDISTDVLAAMRIIAEARELARTTRGQVAKILEEVLGEQDILSGAVGELTAALVRRFYPDGRAARADDIAAFLRRYAREAREAGRLGGFLTDVPSPAAVLRTIDPKAFADVPDQFTRAPRGAFAGEARAAEIEQAQDLARTDPPAGAFDQGADSPAVIEADATIAQELREAAEQPFGPVFTDLTGDPEGAIARLMERQTGDVPDAFIHPELGPIRFVWGSRTLGLRHILEKHGEAVLKDLPRALREGRLGPEYNGRRNITTDDTPPRRTVLRLDWNGDGKPWVLTSHDLIQGTDARPGRTSNGLTASASPSVPDATARSQDMPGARSAQADTAEADDFVPVRVDEDAAAAEEAARAQLRAELGDLSIRLADDTEWSARDILTDLDADETLAATIDFCVTRPGGVNG
jgi:hypothetical protein